MDKPDELTPSDETVLFLDRIKTIMKWHGAAEISKEALFLMAKITELFVQYFVREAHETSKKNGVAGIIEYEHLAQLVDKSKELKFLLPFVPKKISVKELKKISLDDDDDTDDQEGSGAESND